MDTRMHMKSGLLLALLLGLVSHVVAQDFNTRPRPGNSRASYNADNGGRMVSPWYTAPADYANRQASYRVERDSRYMGALPARALSAPKSWPATYSNYTAPNYAAPNYAARNASRNTTGYGTASVTSYLPPGPPSCAYGGCDAAGRGAVYRGQTPAAYPPAAYAPALPRTYAPPVGYGHPQPRPVSRYETPKGYYRGDGIFGKDTVYAENQPVRNFFRYMMP